MELFENNGANFSPDRNYRYCLWRIWDESKPMIMFIGLNPSTGNEDQDDPTIRRIKGFANKWNFGGIYMLNLFTYITAYPEELKKCQDYIKTAITFLGVYSLKSEKIVFAWGSFPEAHERARKVISIFPKSFCLGKNIDGSPKHPLYLKRDTELIPFT
jgi:hypothetical protein